MAKLKDLSVSFLSLVKTPATGKGLTLKSANPGERASTFSIIKTDDERMVAYGIVYAPDQEDAHGDTADIETIRKAAYEFMREARLKNIDTEHSFNTEMAYVCESWLVRKGDELFPDEPEGAWAVGIRIGDPDLWKQLKSGELTGISLAGIARMEPEPDDPTHPQYTEKNKKQSNNAAPGWVERLIKALTRAHHQDPQKETDMDREEVQEIVRDTLKSELGEAITDALKSAGVGDNTETADPAQSEIEKAVAAALKNAGLTAENAPSTEGESKGKTDIEKAVAKALEPFKTKLDDQITKALAKGVTETDPSTKQPEESFV